MTTVLAFLWYWIKKEVMYFINAWVWAITGVWKISKLIVTSPVRAFKLLVGTSWVEFMIRCILVVWLALTVSLTSMIFGGIFTFVFWINERVILFNRPFLEYPNMYELADFYFFKIDVYRDISTMMMFLGFGSTLITVTWLFAIYTIIHYIYRSNNSNITIKSVEIEELRS